MKFQIKGQKENLLILAKEGKGVEFKGNIYLSVVNIKKINLY